MHHPAVHAVAAVPDRRPAEHLVHHAVHDDARLAVVHGLVAEPAAHVRAPAPQVEAVAAVVRGPVAVEGIAAAAEGEAVLAVVLGDAALDRVALALGDEPGHPVAAEAHADRARQRAPSACEHAHAEPLDRSRTLQREAAAHDEDADALPLAADRAPGESERHRARRGDEEPHGGARLARDAVGGAERARGDEQIAAGARHRLAVPVDVVTAGAHGGGGPGGAEPDREREREDEPDGRPGTPPPAGVRDHAGAVSNRRACPPRRRSHRRVAGMQESGMAAAHAYVEPRKGRQR